jgi:hypothetical protein
MKVSNMNEEVQNIKNPSYKKGKLINVLSNIFDTILRFEKNSSDLKSDRDKLVVLKELIIGMVKDEDQKNVIRGEG